jgi:queuine tRNA-ribosyltransferase
MSWNGAILTDSGGYQVMSLSDTRKISDDGVTFKSHLDGSLQFLSPERAIQIQAQLGVDVSMCLDECPPYPCTKDEAAAAMLRTHRWAPRNLEAAKSDQGVFGIVQGGVHEDLRRESAAFLSELNFDGMAIGGVCVGEPTEMQYPVVKLTAPLLPSDKVRYLMGVGHPADIIHAVACGVDMFDCVLPTRMARHHVMYTKLGRMNLLNAKFAEMKDWPDPESVFEPLSRYSPAYVRHLLRAKEPLGARLLSINNLAFYARLMSSIRDAIEKDSWEILSRDYALA